MSQEYATIEPQVEDPGSGSPSVRALTVWGFLIAAVQLGAALLPTSLTWGIHHLGFLPFWTVVAVPLVMMLVSIPSVRTRILFLIEGLAGAFRSRPKKERITLLALMALVAVASFWSLREAVTFLGDGYLLTHLLNSIGSAQDLTRELVHEPFARFVVWIVYRALVPGEGAQSGPLAYAIVSIISGAGFLVALFFFVRLISDDAVERALLYGLVLFSAGSQLFFGYMENYPPAYVGLLLFVLLGVLYIRGRVPIVVPAMALAGFVIFYFGMLVFIPALLVLFAAALRRRNYGGMALALGAMAALAAVMLWVCGYSMEVFVTSFSGGGSHIVPVFARTSTWQGYTFFSSKHLIDVANFCLLTMPVVLFTLIVTVTTRFRTLPWKDEEWLFLVMVGCCGMGMILFFNCDIGMCRDWDLLATFSLGVIILSGAAWRFFIPAGRLRNGLLLAATAITILHTIPWILVNSDQDSAIARFNVLLKNSLWGENAFKVNEELALYYREHQDYRRSIDYYREFLKTDSTNYRIWGNIGDMYRLLGDEDQEIENYRRAADLGTASPAVYRNLGGLYGARLRYDDAIAMMKRSLALSPHQVDLINGIGALLLNKTGSCQEALGYFTQAIAEDSTYVLAYVNAAKCALISGDRPQARSLLGRYLAVRGTGIEADRVRELLTSIKEQP